MAVTNAQVLTELESLKAMVEEKFSFGLASKEDAERIFGELNRLGNIVAKNSGEAIETVNTVHRLQADFARLEQTVLSAPRAGASKTLKQRWDELMNSLMGTNPARY